VGREVRSSREGAGREVRDDEVFAQVEEVHFFGCRGVVVGERGEKAARLPTRECERRRRPQDVRQSSVFASSDVDADRRRVP